MTGNGFPYSFPAKRLKGKIQEKVKGPCSAQRCKIKLEPVQLTGIFS
jgi:hypothetical protein